MQSSPLQTQPSARLAALAFLLYFHFWCSFFFFSQLKGIKLETVWCLSTMHLHVYLYQHLASGASLLFHSLWANALCIAAAWGSRAWCYSSVTNTCSVLQHCYKQVLGVPAALSGSWFRQLQQVEWGKQAVFKYCVFSTRDSIFPGSQDYTWLTDLISASRQGHGPEELLPSASSLQGSLLHGEVLACPSAYLISRWCFWTGY